AIGSRETTGRGAGYARRGGRRTEPFSQRSTRWTRKYAFGGQNQSPGYQRGCRARGHRWLPLSKSIGTARRIDPRTAPGRSPHDARIIASLRTENIALGLLRRYP